jgi:predicted Fe-S protein YdhL (DUF1289 family)
MAPDPADERVASPCIGVCVLDPGGSAVCVGCGRTLDEIGEWTDLDNAERRAVIARLPARLEALARRNRARHWDADADR